MTRRNKMYFHRKKAIERMARFTDLRSLLVAGFEASKSIVVKRDILSMLRSLEQPRRYARAS